MCTCRAVECIKHGGTKCIVYGCRVNASTIMKRRKEKLLIVGVNLGVAIGMCQRRSWQHYVVGKSRTRLLMHHQHNLSRVMLMEVVVGRLPRALLGHERRVWHCPYHVRYVESAVYN